MQQKTTVRERIVSAAKLLFAERGFHRTSMADLAEFAQVSVGTIYRVFPGKSEIIRAIIQGETERTLGQLKTAIEQVRSGEVDGAAAVEQMIFEWALEQSDALEHEVVAEGHRNPEIGLIISEICAQFRDLFRTLARLLQPGLSDEGTEGVAELLLACLFGMGNRSFTQPRQTEAEAAASVARLIIRGAQASDR